MFNVRVSFLCFFEWIIDIVFLKAVLFGPEILQNFKATVKKEENCRLMVVFFWMKIVSLNMLLVTVAITKNRRQNSAL